MFGDLLSSRLIQGGVAFFVLVVGGSLLYSWHVQRTTETELGPIPLAVESLENTPETNTSPVDFQTEGVVNTPDETTDTQKSEASEVLPNDPDDIADAFLPADFVSEEEAPAEDVPVSPFGFGPYPEVPADFPNHLTPPWHWSEDHKNAVTTTHLMRAELLYRVLIELWNQGESISGGTIAADGKVLPYYANTAYAKYKNVTLPDGTIRKAIELLVAPPDTLPDITPQMEISGIVPGVQLLDMEAEGIDPYTFLNIK